MTTPATPRRIAALDVVRGMAVFAMLLVNNPGVPAATPALLRHAPWHGLTLADLVFPLFLLSMGVCLPLSSRATGVRSMIRRVLLLALLGCALSMLKRRELLLDTGVLQHIAGSYLLAWLALRLPRRGQVAAVATVLGGAWLAYELVGSWAPGSNAAALVDTALLHGPSPEGVLVTIISATNVVAGAWVGSGLRGAAPDRALAVLSAWGFGATLTGLTLALAMPVNKRLWTPAFAVLTHGLACLVLLVVHVLVDRLRARAWSAPFLLLGRNPIAVYVAVTGAAYTVVSAVKPGVVEWLVARLAPAAASVAYALLLAAGGLALAALLARRRLFLRL